MAQLIEMAVEFFADQAASVATLGIAEAALPVIIEAGQKLSQSLIQDLEQYVIGKVIKAALKPFFAKVESMLAGLDWGNTGKAESGVGDFVQPGRGRRRARRYRYCVGTLRRWPARADVKSGLAG